MLTLLFFPALPVAGEGWNELSIVCVLATSGLLVAAYARALLPLRDLTMSVDRIPIRMMLKLRLYSPAAAGGRAMAHALQPEPAWTISRKRRVPHRLVFHETRDSDQRHLAGNAGGHHRGRRAR